MWKGDALETLDVGIGILGFFTFAFFVVTAVTELMGLDALGWALTLLGFVIVLGLLLLRRRRMVASRRTEAPAPEDSER